MKTVFGLALLLTSTLSQAEINQQCWDGTFGYNYLNAKETSRGVEVTLQGSTLGLPALYNDWDHSFLVDGFSHKKPRLHAILPVNSQVADAEGNITLSVKATQVETANGFVQTINPFLWLEHAQNSLGQSKRVVLDVPLQTLELKLTNEKAILSFVQDRAPGEPTVQTVEVGCLYKQAPSEVQFPSELKKFLDTKSVK